MQIFSNLINCQLLYVFLTTFSLKLILNEFNENFTDSIVTFFRIHYHSIKIYKWILINCFYSTTGINILINIFYKAVYVFHPSLLKNKINSRVKLLISKSISLGTHNNGSILLKRI